MRQPAVGVLLQRMGDVPGHDRWLASQEAGVLAGLRFPKRRDEWRLGRWTAKRAIRMMLAGGEAPDARIRVEAAPDGAPEAFSGQQALPLALSISHRDERAVCAVGPAGTALGCDLETVEPRSTGFVADYFTARERTEVEAATPGQRHLVVALTWSAKESALKALRTGLRSDTRSVEVSVRLDAADPGRWWPLEVRDRATGRRFSGWWRHQDDFVLTVVADPPTGPPAFLGTPGMEGP